MISIKIDFDISDKLVQLMADSTACQFIGNPNNLRGIDWANKELETIVNTGEWHGFKRLGILKIFKSGELVGWSMPRIINPQEYDRLLLPHGVADIYRIGTIYISPEYRGQGISKQAMLLYMQLYPKQVWVAAETNIPSQSLAKSVGLTESGRLYIGEVKQWSHIPFDGYVSSNIIYSSTNHIK